MRLSRFVEVIRDLNKPVERLGETVRRLRHVDPDTDDEELNITLLVNPTPAEITALLAKCDWKCLRGAGTGTRLYVWRAEDGNHVTVMPALKMDPSTESTCQMWFEAGTCTIHHFGASAPKSIRAQRYAVDMEWFQNSPALQRALKGWKIRFDISTDHLGEAANEPGRLDEVESYIRRMLAAEARKAGSYENFRHDFLVQIKHGLYWHWTDDPNFIIDPTKGPRDMSSMGSNEPTPGALMVTSDLSYWASYGNRPYAALIDLSEVPRTGYRQVNRGMGNEFYLPDPSRAKVVKVMSRKDAFAFDRRQNASVGIRNEDDLRRFYQTVKGHLGEAANEHGGRNMSVRAKKALMLKYGKLTTFAEMPRPYQLAMAHYMAVDGEAWEAPSLTNMRFRPEDAPKHLLKDLPGLIKQYGGMKFLIAEVPTEVIEKAIRGIYKDEYDFASEPTTGRFGEMHPRTNRWPAIVSSHSDEFLQDGHHRFSLYRTRGDKTIPLVMYV